MKIIHDEDHRLYLYSLDKHRLDMQSRRVEAERRGREEGFAEGREEGLAEGHEEGLAEGREEGRAESRAEVLKRIRELIARGLTEDEMRREMLSWV